MRRAALLLAALVCAPAAGGDWPHARGPGYDSRSAETGLADGWPDAGPPVLWSRELGTGYAGFAVAGGRAFTLFQTATGMFVVALDADTGGELWRSRVDWPWQPGGQYPGPYATPTVADGRVYYATPAGRVGCAAAADGSEVWAVNVRERFAGRGTEFGYACSPLVEDGRVVLPVGGEGASMVALNAADGSTVWAAGDDPASYCPARPVTVDGRRLVVGFLRNALVLHDISTGERVWRQRLSSSYDEHAAWPLTDGRHLAVASPFRAGAEAFRLTAAPDGVTATRLWAGKQLSNDVCSSVLVDGCVVGFDVHQAQASTHRPSRGALKCVDFLTGRTRWETDTVGQCTPLAADGKLVLWTETGTVVLARADPDHFTELARAQVLDGGGMCWATPALSGRRLFVRDHKRAACVHLGPPADLDPARPLVPPPAAGAGFDWTRLVPHEPDFPNDAPTPAEVGRWFAWCAGVFALAGAVLVVARGGVNVARSVRERIAGQPPAADDPANPERKRGGSPVASPAVVHPPRLRSGFAAELRPGFPLAAFALGAAGTTAVGAWADEFALTWPVSLFVAFRAVVWLGAGRAVSGWRREVGARAALVLFAGLCFGYYRLCSAVGFAAAWAFLLGLLPALPFAVAAVRTRRAWAKWAADALGFAAYFWASGLAPGWKEALSG